MKLKLFISILFFAYYIFFPLSFNADLIYLQKLYPNFYWVIYYYHNYFIYIHGAFSLYFLIYDIGFKIYYKNLKKSENYLKASYFLKVRGISFKQIFSHLNSNVYNNYSFVSNAFLKALAFIYLIAFSSLLWQISLVKKGGIISYEQFYQRMIEKGSHVFLVYPSVFWINQSNNFIVAVVILGILLSSLSVFIRPRLFVYILLWVFYLSIVSFGRDLFHFPWDTFLLEIGFLSMILIFFISRNKLPRIVVFSFKLLFFRQWFSMAMTKIVWSTEYWTDFTYMKFFWLNQPSPTPFSEIFHQFPMVFQKTATFLCLFLELLIPLLLLIGRSGRVLAFIISCILSILIEISGNFGVFNILTITLGLWCLDDIILRRKKAKYSISPVQLKKRKGYNLYLGLTYVIIISNFFYITIQFSKQSNHPLNFTNYFFFDERIQPSSKLGSFIVEVGKTFSYFRIVSPHGVFKLVPNQRLSIQIQSKSNDQKRWDNVNFIKGKDVTDLSFVAPNMNRIAYYLYYQAYGLELRNYLLINQYSKSLPSTMFEITSFIKNGENPFFSNHNDVDSLRIIHKSLVPSNNKRLIWNEKIIDTIYFNSKETQFKPVKSDLKYFYNK